MRQTAAALGLAQWHGTVDGIEARRLLEAHNDELFAHDANGYRPTGLTPVRELLITWEPRR